MAGYIIFFLTGLFFSMVGLGGGSVYVPFFTLLGYDVKSMAIPGGIFLVFITGLSASINFIRHKQVAYSVALPILLGSILTSLVSQHFFYRQAASKTLLLILTIGIFLSGLRSLLLPENFAQLRLKNPLQTQLMGFLLGVVVGFISVMTGIGGGFLMVPVLMHFAYPVKQAVGTSAFVILFTSCVGFLTHWHTTFDKSIVSELLIFGGIVFAGAWIGSKIHAAKLQSHQVKLLMGLALTGLSVFIFFKEIW